MHSMTIEEMMNLMNEHIKTNHYQDENGEESCPMAEVSDDEDI